MSLEGTTIGRYEIIEQLGQGGMAKVFKALDTRLEREVAIKVIRMGEIPESKRDQLLKRFEREAKSQASFYHANIVQVFDYGEHDGAPYLVMAYLSGGTLKDRIEGPMPYQKAAAYLAPIAEALAYAHARNVLHRDVKPSNILFNSEGVPTLADFGIAKLLGDVEEATLTGTGMGIGTPQYMSLEQWRGKPVEATDIYALGVVFYELITGRKPYDAETPGELIMVLATEPLPPPTKFVPDLPDEVAQVVDKALARNPEDRYPKMAEFAAVLDKLSREPLPAPALPKTELVDLGQTVVEPPPAAEEQEPEPAQEIPPQIDEAEVLDTYFPDQDPTDPTPPPVEEAKKPDHHFPEDTPTPPPPKYAKPAPQPKPQKTGSKIPGWVWGLIGMVVVIGIIFGVMQLGGRETPVADSPATQTATEKLPLSATALPTNTNPPQPTASETSSPTALPTATEIPAPTPTPHPLAIRSNNANQLVVLSILYSKSVYYVTWSSDSTHLATFAQDYETRIWNTDGWEQLALLNNRYNIIWLPDGNRLATRDNKTASIKTWDADTAQEQSVLKIEDGNIYSFSWTNDGTLLAIRTGNNEILIWDVTNEEELNVIDYTDAIYGAIWSPDGTLLAIRTEKNAVHIWDVTTQKDLVVLEEQTYYSWWNRANEGFWSPDGSHLALIGTDNSIQVWDTTSWERVAFFETLEHSIRNLTWSPNGSLLATTGYYSSYYRQGDTSIHIWDISSQEEIATLAGHSEGITSIDWSPNGTLIASGSDDNTTRIWDTSNWEEIAVLTGPGSDVNSVAWSPNGTMLASGSYDGTIRIWGLPEE